MAIREILRLGNPRLHDVSTEITANDLSALKSVVDDLHDTMMAFRERWGCGRAIAAPQIGVAKRLIYMHIDKPTVIVNPILTDLSGAMIELWDDCMSFPELLVQVRRHKSLTLRFRDMQWQEQEWRLEGDLAELIQHEYDHLDGILATQRAIDNRSIAMRSQRHLLE